MRLPKLHTLSLTQTNLPTPTGRQDRRVGNARPPCLHIEPGRSYRVAVDLLSEMPDVLEAIGPTRLPHDTVLRTWFARIPTTTWRAFLSTSAEKRTGHGAIDLTSFDRDQPSRHYATCTHYRVRR